MKVGDPIFELRDDNLLLGVVTNVVSDDVCDGKIKIIIPKDAFVAAYDKWIRGDKKSVTRRIVEFIKSHF